MRLVSEEKGKLAKMSNFSTLFAASVNSIVLSVRWVKTIFNEEANFTKAISSGDDA